VQKELKPCLFIEPTVFSLTLYTLMKLTLLESTYAAQFLGFENFIPPFANTGGSDILKGVNYASGGSGIRIETGSHSV